MAAENVPGEALLAALADAATREKHVASTHAELSATLLRLKDACQNDIRSTIGAHRLAGYLQAHEKIKSRFTNLASTMQHTPEGLKLASKTRQQLVAEAKQAVGQLGIDTSKVAQIQKNYIAKAASAVEQAFLAREEAPYVEVSPEKAPSRSHNPWEWRSAPYAGQWGAQYSFGTRGARWASHSESRLTGEINCWSSMSLYGADDSDYTYTNAHSELQFWFRMPAAGLVEVWLYLQAIDTPYGGCLDDEWGFSDASIQERSRPYLWILSPYGSARYGTLLDYRRGEYEGCWGATISPGGGYRYANLFSLDAYAAGQWVLCGVGIQDYNYFWVNDMSCYTYVTSRWFLRDVAVRSTGAP